VGRRRPRPTLGGYPTVFALLAGLAALAAVLATGSTPILDTSLTQPGLVSKH
jgi:hypothetical protein